MQQTPIYSGTLDVAPADQDVGSLVPAHHSLMNSQYFYVVVVLVFMLAIFFAAKGAAVATGAGRFPSQKMPSRNNVRGFLSIAAWVFGGVILWYVGSRDFSNKTANEIYNVIVYAAYFAYAFALPGIMGLMERYFP